MPCRYCSVAFAILCAGFAACAPVEDTAPVIASAPAPTPAPTGSGPCGPPRPFGDRSQMTIAPGATEGPSIDAPETCGKTGWSAGAYVRVHGRGARHLDFSRKPGPCDVPDADPRTCPTVSIHVFAAAVLAALQKGLGKDHVDGLGLGVCGDFHGPLSRWNVSSRVHDWRYVDEALRVIDGELRRWNLGDDYGLSISGIDCAVLL